QSPKNPGRRGVPLCPGVKHRKAPLPTNGRVHPLWLSWPNHKETPMKLSAMTLGCPAWDLETLLVRGKAYGYDGVDFRGLGAELDITRLPIFTADLAKTARRIQSAGLEVS